MRINGTLERVRSSCCKLIFKTLPQQALMVLRLLNPLTGTRWLYWWVESSFFKPLGVLTTWGMMECQVPGEVLIVTVGEAPLGLFIVPMCEVMVGIFLTHTQLCL